MALTIIETLLRFQELEAMARAIGVSDDDYRRIVREVEEKAKATLLWGTVEDRLAEIRRRVLEEPRNATRIQP